jgi:hypothetical protein
MKTTRRRFISSIRSRRWATDAGSGRDSAANPASAT